MDLDQSFLSELPLQHRQKVCRQIRQKQIEKYFEFEKSDRGRELLPRKQEKRNVHFSQALTLQVAVDNFDDREVAKCLDNGCDPNFTTGNGTSLLHRCAAEDNVSAAELLISHGADVNLHDDDWWTPLHTACSCDCPEIANLLVNNGADLAAIDVDGYFPLDQAAEGSEVRAVMTKHMENKGLTERVLHENRQLRPKEFLNYIKSLPLAVDVNMLNKDGVSLLHIAAANGYRNCMKALFRYNADVNRLDNYGWTPLHVAARFNQERSVILLLKQKANPNQEDLLGCKPSAVTSSDKIRGILMKCERKMQQKGQQENGPVYLELDGGDDEDTDDNVYHEIHDSEVGKGREDSQLVGIFRINSKTVRTKHVTISKEDELQEAKQMYEHIAEFSSGDVSATAATAEAVEKDDNKDDEGDYVSMAIWKSASKEQGDLVPCMDGDNLVTVTLVKDDSILTEIQRRYNSKQIYTLIGDVLVAVNPFQTLPCYAKDISLQYHTATLETKLPPHIYHIAEKSYKRLLYNKKSQCHVISGESGAGKSESCKYIIQHLLRVAGSEETNLNSKVNQVNPLLEAFGNAVTVMNNNSSRFGKYVELNFTKEGKVCGAKISEYLLEKSRIVLQGKGEQNFHIFYWMMAGLSHEEISLYKLEKMNQFRYLKSSLPTDQSASENKAKFWEVKECLKYIGFTSADIQNVLKTLSIVLHLGEIEFHGVGNNEAAQVRNTDMLTTVSEMLDVSAEELRSALVADYTVTRGEQIKKERTVQQAIDCRDALAKALYARLFSWIVNGINQLIQPVYEHGIQSVCEHGEDLQLGILDIFGFENFPHNSFEQICINVANEQIQQYTNDNIFQNEQEDCLLEGVPLVDLDYNNNQAILNVFFEKHTGLLAILDEESSFPKATDKSLATKLHQNTGKKHPGCYKTPRDGGLCFTVVHYAGSVMYDVTGMLEKNRDTLPNSILYTMKTSNQLLIKELFQSRITRTGSLAPSARQQRNSRRTKKKSSSPFEFFKKFKANNKEAKKAPKNVSVEKKGASTMAFHFRNSLSDLISKLQVSSPHFVRCIKPNTTKSAFMFVPEYVLAQLRYTGISEIVKIRKFGYALRLPFYDFLNRFHVLVKCCLPAFCPLTDIQKCEEVVRIYGLEHVQFGRTKLFLKSEHVDKLDNLTADLERKVTTAQAVVRGFLGRQKSRRLSAARDEELKRSALVLKNDQAEQAAKSLSSLEEIISDYDDAFTVKRETAVTADDDDEYLYDDAFSVQQHATGDKSGEEDNMNGHLQRGLPPTPTHGMHYDPSRPPPPPKEMYSQGMYASIEDQGYLEYRKQAPPPPKRDPGTRLSTSSTGTYEEIHVTESYTHHQHGHHQQSHSYGSQSPMHSPHSSPAHHPGYHQQPQSYGNQSPVHMVHGSPAHHTGYYQQQQNSGNQSDRHTTHGSPVLKSRAGHEPQSPSSAGSRPFSYGAAILSQKLHHVTDQNVNQNIPSGTQNGHSQQNVPNLSNYQYSDQGGSSPVMNYGKHESAFHPQSHRPPPCGPPPPVPPDHPSQGHRVAAPQPHYPQSPKIQRQSSIQGSVHKSNFPGSPKLAQKLSQRSKSVPCNPEEDLLPAPPPPLTVRENYMAAAQHTNRTPSPPLPPPPPELLTDLPPPSPPPPHPAMLGNVPHMMEPVVNQSLPNSAVSMSPRHQPAAPAAPPPPPPVSSIPKKQGVASNQEGPRPRMALPNENAGSYSPEPTRGHNLQSVAPPRKESSPDQAALIQQINKVQLKRTESLSHETEGERTSSSPKTGMVELSAVKLRQTSARIKLLEKDGIKATSEEPVPEPLPVPQEEAPPPPAVSQPPPAEPQQLTQVTPAVSMFEKKVEMIAKGDQRIRRKGDTSNDSTMDISIDNIDLNDVPGYTPITRSTPVWKRDMIEKKNQEKIQEYIEEKRREKEEAEKWKNVPAWKRKLMMEKQKEQSQKSKEEREKERQAEEARKAKIREQQEMEKKMDEELQDVPAWKREIMMKRGGAIKNWADEREDLNEQELEEQRQAEMGVSDGQKVFTQKATLVLKERENAPSPPPAQSQPKKTSTKKSSVVLHERQDAPSPPPSQPQSNKASVKKTSVVSKEARDEPTQPLSQPQPKKVSPQKTIVLQVS
ncbi:unconventional myosin-XVI-like isoform X4 [Mercenaria mercenaria]|uniref:unconventional myosin-XVI-like isoform X4 n=1 Tax=Mercenaria mercenaria TaxID=6596 RepID=UPI00234F4DC3|nr:unconventional myosin-XVI-like isoform X4 [Mercenaria mercenaria]